MTLLARTSESGYNRHRRDCCSCAPGAPSLASSPVVVRRHCQQVRLTLDIRPVEADNRLVMVVLERLREQTLEKLARHYAAGDLRLGTLEHRLHKALAAEAPAEVAGVTWDLPALESSIWERVRANVSSGQGQPAARRISFETL